MTSFYTNVYQRSDTIYVIGYANGKRYTEEVEYKPYLFLPGHGEFKTLEGRKVQKKQFDTIKEAKEFVNRYETVENFPFYGLTQFQYVFINDEFPGEVQYDTSLIRTNYIDIEVSSEEGFPSVVEADKEVTAITLVRGSKVITFGTKYFDSKKISDKELEHYIKDLDITYVLCDDEKDLLVEFISVWNSDEWCCDCLSSWYGENFDIPYLVNRIKNVLGTKYSNMLSPWRIVNERSIVRGKGVSSPSKDISERTDIIYELAGITQLDYIQLYKKFTPSNHESYRLDNIALVELNEKKLDYSSFGSLDELYKKDPERFYIYNIHDAVLVRKLEEKLGFINQVFALAYSAKTNFIDAFTTTRPWDVIIHNHLMAKGIVIPSQTKPSMYRDLIGAFVMEPKLGLHKNIVSFDFTSLYPSIISQHNISPETFIRNDAEINSSKKIIENRSIGFELDKNLTVCANRCVYNKNIRGFLPELVDLFIDKRSLIKKEMIELQKNGKELVKIGQLDSYQQALKILTNGLYGALANKYFRWFDINFAESITMTGQLYIGWIMKRINEYLNKVLKTENVEYVIAGDTDSIYVNLDDLVKKVSLTDQNKIIDFLDNVSKTKLEPFIDNCCDELAGLLNSYNTKVRMKRESIANKGIWRGKKMYILNLYDKEGVRYKEPKVTYKGIEAVRSSTPMICRNKIRECLRIIMQEEETDLQKYIANFYNEFMKLQVDEIAFPRSVDGIKDYYDPVLICKKKTPIHVRGAINFNEGLKRFNLIGKFPEIKDKDKIRFVYLKEPNPFKSHVIAIPDAQFIPKQFEIDKWVDKEIQWEKAFLSPVKSITDLINWDLEYRTTMDVFFV